MQRRTGFSAPCIVCLVLAALFAIGGFSSPVAFLFAAALGGYAYHLYNCAYASYLHRGGRWVRWIW